VNDSVFQVDLLLLHRQQLLLLPQSHFGQNDNSGWIPIILNDAVLAIVSLVGLLTLILLETFSRLLVLGFVIAVIILAGSIGTLLWSLTHREKLMPLAMAIPKLCSEDPAKSYRPPK
jgi:hypothetical protein